MDPLYANYAREETEKQRCDDKFQGLVKNIYMYFFLLPVYNLSKGFRASLESFWS